MKKFKLEVRYIKPFKEVIPPRKMEKDTIYYVQMHNVDIVVRISRKTAQALVREYPNTLCAVYFTKCKNEIIIGDIEVMKTEKYWER